MIEHTLFVCVLCRLTKSAQQQEKLSDGQSLFDRLNEGLEACDWGQHIHLRPVRCMAACDRACVAAFAVSSKLTFIFSNLSAELSMSDLLQFSHQYIAHSSGNVPYKQRPEGLKKKLLVVLPPNWEDKNAE